MTDYKYLGDFSALGAPHGVNMSCHHCRVYWYGCADTLHCPECGRDMPAPWLDDDLKLEIKL